MLWFIVPSCIALWTCSALIFRDSYFTVHLFSLCFSNDMFVISVGILLRRCNSHTLDFANKRNNIPNHWYSVSFI